MVETAIAAKLLLIVEDNDATREGLGVILRHAGYSTREAANGRQAVEALRAEKPDLILLDMLLAGNGDDGWALLRKFRRNPQWCSIPVVILTSIRIACDEWAVSLGAKAVLCKPANIDELLVKIEHYCH
jgi:twitching motility two-component system response regulator PilH